MARQQKRVKAHLRKIKGRKAKVHIDGHLRQIRTKYKK